MSNHVDDLNAYGKDGLTSFLRAVVSRDEKQVEILLTKGVNIYAVDKLGYGAQELNKFKVDEKTALIAALLRKAHAHEILKIEDDKDGADNSGNKGAGNPMAMVLNPRSRFLENPSVGVDVSSKTNATKPATDSQQNAPTIEISSVDVPFHDDLKLRLGVDRQEKLLNDSKITTGPQNKPRVKGRSMRPS